jgi:anti-sigma factor RsiW
MKEQKKFNSEEILKALKKADDIFRSGSGCPLDRDMFHYVQGDLPEPERSEIAAHIKQCVRCHAKALEMDVERIEWEYMLEQAYQEGLKKIDKAAAPAFEPKEVPAPDIVQPVRIRVNLRENVLALTETW